MEEVDNFLNQINDHWHRDQGRREGEKMSVTSQLLLMFRTSILEQ